MFARVRNQRSYWLPAVSHLPNCIARSHTLLRLRPFAFEADLVHMVLFRHLGRMTFACADHRLAAECVQGALCRSMEAGRMMRAIST